MAIANNAGRRMRITGTGERVELTINIHVVKDPEEFKAAEEVGRLFARLGSAWVTCLSDKSANALRDETWANMEGVRVIRH